MARKQPRKRFGAVRSLITLGSLAVVGAITALSIDSYPQPYQHSPQTTTQPKRDLETTVSNEEEWAFMQRSIKHPENDQLSTTPARKVIERYIPLGKEAIIPREAPEFNHLYGSALPFLKNRGVDIRSISSATITRQIYVVPETNAAITASAKSYAERAVIFAEQEVEGLDIPSIEWKVLEPGDNWTENANGKGFIGKGIFYVDRLYVLKNGERKPSHKIETAQYNVGGVVRRTRGLDGEESAIIALSAYDGILKGVFSEILPLATRDQEREYVLQTGNPGEVTRLAEAWSEGAGYHLALQFTQREGISGARDAVEDAQTGMTPLQGNAGRVYAYVPSATTWIGREGGVQAAYDLIESEGFGAFRNAILSGN